MKRAIVVTLQIAFSWLPFPIGQVRSQCGVDHTWWRTSASLIYEFRIAVYQNILIEYH